MTLTKDMTDEDFDRHTFEILRRELGVNGVARFLRLHRSTDGDYTRDRQNWLERVTVAELMAESAHSIEEVA